MQDRENQGHTFPFMIGRVVGAGDGTCVAKKVTERQTIDGTSYDAGGPVCDLCPVVVAGAVGVVVLAPLVQARAHGRGFRRKDI